MAPRRILTSCGDYTIGWIAVIFSETAAAKSMLDERHDPPRDFQQSMNDANDTNSYAFGCMLGHNIVIATLPAGMYGTTSATATSLSILRTFPNLKFGLLVGIGAAIPSRSHDIRLGDVVVSQPRGKSNGVVQYDFGKAISDDKFEDIGLLAAPPPVLLRALTHLLSEQELGQSKLSSFIQHAIELHPSLSEDYSHPSEDDRLFEASYEHSSGEDCCQCATDQQVERKVRNTQNPRIHAGLITSGNALVRNAKLRDSIRARYPDCLCLEMEAAGLMNEFPCLVIRGISDYADSHKNKVWQAYASLAAAACAKEILSLIASVEVAHARRAIDIRELTSELREARDARSDDRISSFKSALDKVAGFYAEAKDRNPDRTAGTCEWFSKHRLFIQWKDDPSARLLWVSADPGCGKSVLSKYLIDTVLPTDLPSCTKAANSGTDICYFFFKDDFPNQRNATNALAAILLQLLKRNPERIVDSILKEFSEHDTSFCHSFTSLWRSLVTVVNKPTSPAIVCVLDALDECQAESRGEFLDALGMLQSEGGASEKLKFLLTSRPYQEIRTGFRKIDAIMPVIHLKGESDDEVNQMSAEIELVVREQVRLLSKENDLKFTDSELLYNHLISIPNRTYLWVHLVLSDLRRSSAFKWVGIKKALSEVCTSIDEVYERMLSRSSDPARAKRILESIIAAFRPLTPTELIMAVKKDSNFTTCKDLYNDTASDSELWSNIREICGLFVTKVDSKVYLIHQTAKEFLVADSGAKAEEQDDGKALRRHISSGITTWKHSIVLSSAHLRMAETCCWFLDLKGQDDRGNAFGLYCELFLCVHLREAVFTYRAAIASTSLRLIETRLAPNQFAILERIAGRSAFSAQHPLRPDTFPAFVVCLGILPLVERLLAEGKLSAKAPSPGYSDLHLAVIAGNASLVQLLLASGYSGDGWQRRSTTFRARLNSSSNAARKSNSDSRIAMRSPPLHYAILQGRYDLATKLLKNEPRLKSPQLQSLLYQAMQLNRTDLTRLLLDHGADVHQSMPTDVYVEHIGMLFGNRREPAGIPPVLLAIFLNSAALLELLISYGANVQRMQISPTSYIKRTVPLHAAVTQGFYEMSRILLSHGADPNNSEEAVSKGIESGILNVAVRRLDYAMVRLLIEHNARFPATILYNDNLKRRSRMKFVALGNLRLQGDDFQENVTNLLDEVVICSFLADAGIAADKFKDLLIHGKNIRHSLDSHPIEPFSVEELRAGMDSCLNSENRETLLDRAVLNKDWVLVERMVRAGCLCGAPALLAVIEAEHKETLRQLVSLYDQGDTRICNAFNFGSRHRKDIITTDISSHECSGGLNFGMRTAVRAANKTMVQRMLNDGALVNAKDLQGRTAISLAVTYGYSMDKSSISPEELTKYTKEYQDIVRLLLMRGADRAIRDRNGLTAADRAEEVGNTWYREIFDLYDDLPTVETQREPAIVYGPDGDSWRRPSASQIRWRNFKGALLDQ